MDKLVQYIRLVFEERYLKDSTPFCCMKKLVQDGFGRCICIPGIAINYCVLMGFFCYEDVELDIRKIEWNDQLKIYLPICMYEDKRIVQNLSDEYACEALLSEDVCIEKTSSLSYVKIRGKEVLERIFETSQGTFYTEICLLEKIEKFSNSMDYLRLFVIIADSSRLIMDSYAYADLLFRLFLFLRPYTMVDLIKKCAAQNQGNQCFKEYNQEVLRQYLLLGENMKGIDVLSSDSISYAINEVAKFIGFDFMNVYERYKDVWGLEAVRELNELIKKQLDSCLKSTSRIKNLARLIDP